MNSTSNLTDKQRYQREYYARNKIQICKKKREIYAADNPRKPKHPIEKKNKPGGSNTPTPPCKATAPVRLVNKMPKKARHYIEDIQQAKALGISVEELEG